VVESAVQMRLFQAEGPTFEKVPCCLLAVQACGCTKSPLEAERRDYRAGQDEEL